MTPDLITIYLDSLAKPPGSLGRLEVLAARLAQVQGRLDPVTRPRRLVLFAGDHGVVAQGVTAWPQDVTGAMIATIASGRSASAVLATATDTALRLVDVGSAAQPLADPPGFYREARIRAGSRDLSREPALTGDEFDAAWAVGAKEAQLAADAGMVVLAAGEMGIGNTTAAAALTALLTGLDPLAACGRGAGADDATLARKQAVVTQALARVAGDPPKAQIAALCGFEIAAMAGFFAQAARLQRTIVLDGYVATSAALVADVLVPGTTQAMIAAHASAEPGHAAALAHLRLDPLLDWGLRLGEGTGALLAMPMLDAAAALLSMATLREVLG